MTKNQILKAAKPILFNADMVRAISNDRKTVTRRLVKQNTDAILSSQARTEHPELNDAHFINKLCSPPFQPGDILYVRETWCKLYHLADDMCTLTGEPHYYYAADGYNPTPFNSFPDEDGFCGDRNCPRWHPSIHMPKEAARIFLRVTGVRMERLQDAKLSDFLGEGISLLPEAFNDPDNAYLQTKRQFSSLWNSTIKTVDLLRYGWDANPWVWAIKFERIILKG